MRDALKALADAEKAAWAHFGEEPRGLHINDKTASPWRDAGGVIEWTEEGYGEYSGEIYGDSEWSSETHTIAVLQDNGHIEAYLFSNSNMLEE